MEYIDADPRPIAKEGGLLTRVPVVFSVSEPFWKPFSAQLISVTLSVRSQEKDLTLPQKTQMRHGNVSHRPPPPPELSKKHKWLKVF